MMNSLLHNAFFISRAVASIYLSYSVALHPLRLSRIPDTITNIFLSSLLFFRILFFSKPLSLPFATAMGKLLLCFSDQYILAIHNLHYQILLVFQFLFSLNVPVLYFLWPSLNVVLIFVNAAFRISHLNICLLVLTFSMLYSTAPLLLSLMIFVLLGSHTTYCLYLLIICCCHVHVFWSHHTIP